jgi:hypothetical protein
MTATSAAQPTRPAAVATRSLLTAGLVAGPLYVGVSLAQALTREAFDLTRHPWSALANGDLGWVQMANLIGTGLLVGTFAAGLRRVLAGGRGSRWAPRLLTLFGAGMIVAGFLPADPVAGFPAGTPADYAEVSWHGVGHMMAASIGFVGVVAACFVLARRFAADGERGWAVASRVVGAFFLLSFVGMSATGGSAAGIVAFTLGVVAVFAWITALAVRSRREAPAA